MGVAEPLGAAVPLALPLAAPWLRLCNGRINAVAGIHSSGSLPHVCAVGLHLGMPEDGAQE